MPEERQSTRRPGSSSRAAVLRLGVSRCLLGEKVRYDGQDKRYPWVAEELHDRSIWVGVCPEVELGMPVPREPVQLEGRSSAPRMLGVESRRDHTCEMHRWAGEKLRVLAIEDLDGFVLKARSPSCGLGDADLIGPAGAPVETVDGLFAAALRRIFPHLPLTTEALLEEPGERERFLLHARCYQAFKRAVALGAGAEDLAEVRELALQALRARQRTDLAEALEIAHLRACDGDAKELAAYGQLLHELLSP